MDYSNQIVNLFILMTVKLIISYSCQSCSFINGDINCENFSSFSELTFENVNETVKSISLKPTIQILFDDSLELSSLNFATD